MEPVICDTNIIGCRVEGDAVVGVVGIRSLLCVHSLASTTIKSVALNYTNGRCVAANLERGSHSDWDSESASAQDCDEADDEIGGVHGWFWVMRECRKRVELIMYFLSVWWFGFDICKMISRVCVLTMAVEEK